MSVPTKGSGTHQKVGVAALLIACGGQDLADAQILSLTLDGDGSRIEAAEIDPGWESPFGAFDTDRDGDEELLVLGPSIAAMQADGRTMTLVDVSAEQALWSPRPDAASADLIAWTAHSDDGIIHAACDLADSPKCTVSGTIAIAEPVESIVVGDFDEDGRIDIVTSGNGVGVRASGGDDWRHPSWSDETTLLARESAAIATTDLDGDGHLDVLAAAGTLGLRFFFGAGDGTFEQVRPSFNDELRGVYSVQLAALDGDDIPELVLVTDAEIVVLRRVRGRTFVDAAFPATMIPAGDLWDADLVVGDFDGDARDELMLVHEQGSWFADFDPDSREWGVRRVADQSFEIWSPWLRVAADLDGDGRDAVAYLVPEGVPVECSIGRRRT